MNFLRFPHAGGDCPIAEKPLFGNPNFPHGIDRCLVQSFAQLRFFQWGRIGFPVAAAGVDDSGFLVLKRGFTERLDGCVVQGRNRYDYPRFFTAETMKSENLVEPGVSSRRNGFFYAGGD